MVLPGKGDKKIHFSLIVFIIFFSDKTTEQECLELYHIFCSTFVEIIGSTFK